MTVILAIAKGIGIFLLILLAILVLALLSVLFVPVRYRAEGEYLEEFRARASVTWFFRLICLSVSWNGGFSYMIRVAGIPLHPPKKGGENDPEGIDGEPRGSGTERPEERESAGTGPEETVRGTGIPEGRSDRKRTFDGGAKIRRGGRNALLQKVCRIRNRFLEKRADAERAKERFLWYWNLLQREDSRRALSRAGGELKRLLSHCLPKKGLIRATAGAEDPAVTGGLLALQGVLYPLICDRILILPDFETSRLEGTFWMKGRIRACVVCYCVLRVILNRECRLLLARLRKKEEA